MSPDPTDTPVPKAYSYLRFSTPEQQKGDSFNRQTRLAAEYAARRGLELDNTLRLHDIGVSAFRGRNAIDGHLGRFREHVQSGEVPRGSILLVESLDRLSRQEIGEAQWAFLDLLRSGVRVVTLLDETEYSWESANSPTGMMSLIISLTILSRAHEESATKARRLKAAWEAKRSNIADTPLTSVVPAWIELDKAKRELRLIPERAAIVERIFRETLEGLGQHQIAQRLNLEGVKPWGRGAFWQRSYIAKVLESEAVIGTFTPHTLEYVEGKRTRKPQEKVEGYFPPAISQDLWADVRAFSDGKHARARGRHTSAPVTNMLAGMAVCPLCGDTMTRTNKGARSKPKYVCVRAKNRAGCSYRSVSVALVEDAILTRLPERLRDAPAGERDPQLDRELRDAEGAVEEAQQGIEKLLTAIEKGGETTSLVQRLRQREADFETARAKVRELEGRRAAVAGATVHARIGKLLATLEPEDGGQPQPGAVNLALQSVFRRATVDYRWGVLECEWLHGGSVEVPYALPD